MYWATVISFPLGMFSHELSLDPHMRFIKTHYLQFTVDSCPEFKWKPPDAASYYKLAPQVKAMQGQVTYYVP